jgi:hypothetical protein
MFTPEFSQLTRKINPKISSPKDFELKRVVLGKENISSNQKKCVASYDYEFTSDESVAVNKKHGRKQSID